MIMIPIVMPLSAAAAGTRSSPTSFGVIADFVAETMEFAAELTIESP